MERLGISKRIVVARTRTGRDNGELLSARNASTSIEEIVWAGRDLLTMPSARCYAPTPLSTFLEGSGCAAY